MKLELTPCPCAFVLECGPLLHTTTICPYNWPSKYLQPRTNGEVLQLNLLCPTTNEFSNGLNFHFKVLGFILR